MTDEILIAHQAKGTGAPVLLLNGIAMTIPGWGPFATRLEARCRVVRCDFRGQRLSPGAAREDIAAHALDVMQVLDQLDIREVHVAGTSFGGFVGTLIASRWPARVASLAVFGGSTRVDDRIACAAADWRAASQLVLDGRADRALVFDHMARSVFAPSFLAAHEDDIATMRLAAAEADDAWFRGLIELVDSVRDLDVTPLTEKIRCPALVVAGELDEITPPATCERLAQRIIGCEYAVLPRTGHAMVQEQPDRLANLYLEFLGRHGA